MPATTTPFATDLIRFGYTDCTLGTVLVAASDKGIVAILIGDRFDRLQRDLEEAFPAKRLVRDDGGLAELFDRVAAFLDAPHTQLDCALDIRGSPQDRAIWDALRAVPPGTLMTYGAIAKTLGVTAQEVGAACAANILAVAIPCHRVVKADGSISGYRWGVHRKKRLINREAVA